MMTEAEAIRRATAFIEDKIEDLGLELEVALRQTSSPEGPIWTVMFKIAKHPFGPTAEPDEIWVEVVEATRTPRIFPLL